MAILNNLRYNNIVLKQNRSDMTNKKINFDKILFYLKNFNNETDNLRKQHYKNIIILKMLPFVKKIAYSLARRASDPVEDIVHVGIIGLIKAIESFNSKISLNFKSYSTYAITGEIKHYLRDKVSMIKPPREYVQLAYKISKLQDKFQKKHNRYPNDLELAHLLQTSVSKINQTKDIEKRKNVISFDQIVFDGQNFEFNITYNCDYENELKKINETKIVLKQAIEKLEPQMQQIVNLVYFEDFSQKETAKRLGINEMQVSRKLKKALEQLFNILNDAYEVK